MTWLTTIFRLYFRLFFPVLVILDLTQRTGVFGSFSCVPEASFVSKLGQFLCLEWATEGLGRGSNCSKMEIALAQESALGSARFAH